MALTPFSRLFSLKRWIYPIFSLLPKARAPRLLRGAGKKWSRVWRFRWIKSGTGTRNCTGPSEYCWGWEDTASPEGFFLWSRNQDPRASVCMHFWHPWNWLPSCASSSTYSPQMTACYCCFLLSHSSSRAQWGSKDSTLLIRNVMQ